MLLKTTEQISPPCHFCVHSETEIHLHGPDQQTDTNVQEQEANCMDGLGISQFEKNNNSKSYNSNSYLPKPSNPVSPIIPETHPEAMPITDRIFSILCIFRCSATESKTSFVFVASDDISPWGLPSRPAMGSIMMMLFVLRRGSQWSGVMSRF